MTKLPFSRTLSPILRSPALPSVAPAPDRTGRRVAVVTGATSGIGKAAASSLSDAGFHVIGTSRNPDSVSDRHPGVHYVALDLSDPDSIEACVEDIHAHGDAPAVLVNNAGESQSGPFEELPRDALERLFQINVQGQVELTQKLLPSMRAAGRGRVVMVGSMLGSFPLAFRSSYVASKAAIKGFGFSLRREVRPFGIGVSVVEPGSINTGLSQRRTKYVDLQGPYGAEFSTMLNKLDANEAAGISSERVAEEIMKAVLDDAPRPLYAAGSKAGLIFPLSRVLPLETTHWLLNKVHGLS
ncbi:SDR family oxidoreductase [Corynebacterium sp. 320]|uniref:SDR family oxidoreductase n=1 Tax=Corynebacterium TaxID=1716 RepID=UPI00125CAAAF|nr:MULTISPECIES: SDR family oxidoreductase [Corynebacterium]KAB1503119.1 SDR family oxidoreductase [Corynebacterium sp. 320]KAB1550667.1 SDR family oxidoreductase [Corynebacterium sp. 321]KAB1551029.1 SDR family oxidoreductase [Corynebacterium sp. 319]KAB3526916.1 SDR family oxidoreductase [Corynebacterium sp. 250]KAB3538409.1 SDR family oxidoreductase [Corynebacterium sp. 366]